MQRSRLSLIPTFTLAAVAALVVVGCAPEADNSTPAPDTAQDDQAEQQESSEGSAASTGEAVFTYGDTIYTAELEFCALSDTDALFHGPAYDESGAGVGYLDGDFQVLGADALGEGRIDFGATGNLQSTDEFIAIGDVGSSFAVAAFGESGWNIIGGGWDQNGAQQSGAMLKVTC